MSDRPTCYAEPDSFELYCHESPAREYPEEAHCTVQVCIPLTGAQYLARRSGETGRRIVKNLTETDILVLPQGQPHAIGWRRHAGIVSFQLHPEFISQALGMDTWRVQDGLILRDPFLSRVARELRAELSGPAEVPAAFVHSLATTVAYRIVRSSMHAKALDMKAAEAPLSLAQIKLVDSYIAEHLHRAIRVSDLARIVGLSPWHFSRRFLATHGTPPLALVTHRRMRHAQHLLRYEPVPIAAIAARLALSPEHFSRTFVRHFGVSPQEYRRSLAR